MSTPNIAVPIERFLNNDTEKFVIPNYQRRFSWENKQITDLFYDIHYLNRGQKHLLNMTILITIGKGRPNLVNIVDGQQRITTLILLIKVLSKKYKNFNKHKLYKDDYLYDMKKCLWVHTTNGKKSKLKLGRLDSREFENIMDENDQNTNSNSSLLQNAYNVLSQKIDSFTLEEVEKFWLKLKNDVEIIVFRYTKRSDAYKLFEITNNRGLALTKTDIIKNFILGHIAIIVGRSDKDERRLRNVLKKWQEIIITLEGIKKDDFFRHFLMGRIRRKVSFSQLVEKFKEEYFLKVKDVELLTEYKRYKDKNNVPDSTKRQPIEKFLDDLIKNSKVYKQIIKEEFKDPKLNTEIINLNKVEAIPAYTFLLNLFSNMEVGLKEEIKIIKLLQSFMLRRQVCKSATGILDAIFSNLCKQESNNIVNNVKEELKKDFPSDEDFIKNFIKFDFNVDRAKYVLGKIEYYINPPAEKMIDWEQVHLEHIIPKKIKTTKSKKEYGDWERYLGNDVEKHMNNLNKIGNLTLLQGKLNIIASNNVFSEKKYNYKQSDIQITRDLCDYRFFKIKNLNDRSKKLSQYAEKIWRF
jgi:uncharacterized protein with ParB-like and HNH nuclease domain